MKKRILALILAITLTVCAVPFASASVDAETAADSLYDLGLFQGVGNDERGNPIYDLDRAPTRYEAVTMLVRLIGKEDEALKTEWYTMPFTDVANWAKPYVNYAYENGLTKGMSSTSFGGKTSVTASQYITFILRALGYSESAGDFKWNSAWTLSDKLGITNGEYSEKANSILRSGAVLVSYFTLKTDMKYENSTLAENLCRNGAVSKESVSAFLGIAAEDINTSSIDTKYFSIAIPDSWAGNYSYSITPETGGGYSLRFSEKQSKAAGFGGHIFTIVLCGTDYSEFPSYEYIGNFSVPSGNHFDFLAVYPSDVQFDGRDGEAAAVYTKMSQSVDYMLSSVKPKNGCTLTNKNAYGVTWQNAYAALLKETGKNYPHTLTYYIYDIDKNEIPELFIKYNSCEADYNYSLYTYYPGREAASYVTNFFGGHRILCGLETENAFLIQYGHMGYESVTKCLLYQGAVSETLLYEDESPSYYDLKPIKEYETNDFSGLNWTKNKANSNHLVIADINK